MGTFSRYVQSTGKTLGAEPQTRRVVHEFTPDGGLRLVKTREVPMSPVSALLLRERATFRRKYEKELPFYNDVDLILSIVDEIPNCSVTDLGCGRENSPDGANFTPDFCRKLTAAGVTVSGIEWPPFENSESFHQFLNLRNPDALKVCPDNSRDIVNAKSLIGHHDYAATSPWLYYHPNDLPLGEDPVYLEIENGIFNQVIRILKPGGVFIVNEFFVYAKDEGPWMFSFVDLSERRMRRQGGFNLRQFVHFDEQYLIKDAEESGTGQT